MIPRYFGTVLDWKFIYNKALVDGKYDRARSTTWPPWRIAWRP